METNKNMRYTYRRAANMRINRELWFREGEIATRVRDAVCDSGRTQRFVVVRFDDGYEDIVPQEALFPVIPHASPKVVDFYAHRIKRAVR